MTLKTATLVTIIGLGLGLACYCTNMCIAISQGHFLKWPLSFHLVLLYGSLLFFFINLYRKS